uniref:Serine/threonine-protein phosphatase 2A activator n=1 Tax=Hirondellea gigas TaxID=1518452 RepID=A0A2P2HYK7_9CRUS
MAVSVADHEFRVPTRAVMFPEDVNKWEKSEAYQDLLGFLKSLNESVRGKCCSSACDVSAAVQGLLDMLDTMASWLKEYPPIDQPQRYGNKAFRDYYARLSKDAAELVTTAVGAEYSAGSKEVSVYLVESVGNSTRIDYGTGHELAFLMFLACLFKIEALKKEDAQATVNKVFKRYVELARELQATYKMEPAGSQGVWSLDDYQFVPFIWGSSQLIMNPKIAPEMFTSEKVVEQYADDYLFLSCIKFILQVKTGPFAEHSNQLWNISGVQSWSKINQGLVKMYKAEVLHKFPVVQHVLFGSLLSITAATTCTHQPPPPSGPQYPTAMPPPPSSSFTRIPPQSTLRSHSVDLSAMKPPFGGAAAMARKPSLDTAHLPTSTAAHSTTTLPAGTFPASAGVPAKTLPSSTVLPSTTFPTSTTLPGTDAHK